MITCEGEGKVRVLHWVVWQSRQKLLYQVSGCGDVGTVVMEHITVRYDRMDAVHTCGSEDTLH